MARTKHQIITKAAVAVGAFKAGKSKSAKNSALKQAAHTGRAPVTDPRNAQPGFAAVPVSTVALPPGQGPQMSSTPSSAGRGRNPSKGKVTGPIRGFSGVSSAAPHVAAIQNQSGSVAGSSKGASPRRGRGKSKKR